MSRSLSVVDQLFTGLIEQPQRNWSRWDIADAFILQPHGRGDTREEGGGRSVSSERQESKRLTSPRHHMSGELQAILYVLRRILTSHPV